MNDQRTTEVIREAYDAARGNVRGCETRRAEALENEARAQQALRAATSARVYADSQLAAAFEKDATTYREWLDRHTADRAHEEQRRAKLFTAPAAVSK